jgi:periplasmic divalent cation tolerance protein
MSLADLPVASGAELVVILCTFPSGNDWGEIAQTLLGERLCACVNQVREVSSVYRWQGEIVTNREVVCVIKSTAARYSELVERLTELHPYDVPEIVRLSVESVNQAYLDWVVAECDPGAASGRTDGDGQLDEI